MCLSYVLCARGKWTLTCKVLLLQLNTGPNMNETSCLSVYLCGSCRQHCILSHFCLLISFKGNNKIAAFRTQATSDKHTHSKHTMLLNCGILATTMLKDLIHVTVYMFLSVCAVTGFNALC